MNRDIVLILILAGLVLFSAYFSATETAFSSLNRIKMKNMAAKGNKRAERTLVFADKFDRILSTILIGNNIVNIGAASIGTVLFTRWYGDAGVSLSTVVITVVVLIFGEITPKVIAKDMPERFAIFSVPLLKVFYTVFYPLNTLFSFWKKLISGIFHTGRDQKMTEEELLLLVDEAQQEGGIAEEAGDLIRSAIEFEDLEAIDICTPRVAIAAVAENTALQCIAETFKRHGFSRLPVYQDSIDNIVGVINQKDFYARVLEAQEPLTAIISPITVIRPNLRISKLMRLLQQKRSHIALIVDEYGGTLGIVTLEDILEELVGEIWDEHDVVVKEIEPLSETEYRVSGRCSFSKLLEELGLQEEEEESDFVSLNGWLLRRSEHMPRIGDILIYQNLEMRVSNATQRAVTEVIVNVQQDSAPLRDRQKGKAAAADSDQTH